MIQHQHLRGIALVVVAACLSALSGDTAHPAPRAAEAAGTILSLSPPTKNVVINSQVQVDVRVSGLTTPTTCDKTDPPDGSSGPCGLGAFSVEVTFDPAVADAVAFSSESQVQALFLGSSVQETDGVDNDSDGTIDEPDEGARDVSCFPSEIDNVVGSAGSHCASQDPAIEVPVDIIPLGPEGTGALTKLTIKGQALGSHSLTLSGLLLDITGEAAIAASVQGNTLKVIMCPDVNDDNTVNQNDLQIIANNFGDRPNADGNGDGILGYTTQRDVNGDGVLNQNDQQVIATVFLPSCPAGSK